MSTKGWAWWKVNISTLALSLLNWTMATTAIKPRWDIIAAEDQLKPPSPSSIKLLSSKTVTVLLTLSYWSIYKIPLLSMNWCWEGGLSMSRGTAFGRHRCHCIYPCTDYERGDLQCPGGLSVAGTDIWDEASSRSGDRWCIIHVLMLTIGSMMIVWHQGQLYHKSSNNWVLTKSHRA